MRIPDGISMPAGEPGDRVHFSEFILANVRLYALRNDKKLSTRAVANFTRNELATALRKACHPLLACVVEISTWGRMLAVLTTPMPVGLLLMLYSCCCRENKHTLALAYLLTH